MKEITAKELEKLVAEKYIKNSHRGFLDAKDEVVGFYRTRHKRYIEDKYVDIAKTL